MSLRVCHLGKYYPPAPGGIETHLQTLARAQVDLGLDVRVLCLNHQSKPVAPENDHGVDVQRFNDAFSVFELKLCRELRHAIRRAHVDILHLHVPNPSMLLHLFAARPNVPLVVTYHSDIVKQRIRAALFRPIEHSVYRRVAKILTTTPLYAAGSEFLQSYVDRLEVLPMGLDLEPYLNPSEAHRAEAAAISKKYPGPIWFSCGRLTYYKGMLTAIRALQHIAGTLIIIGSGQEEDPLQTEVRALKLTERVVFIGHVPTVQDIIPYYLAATALLFPSNARSEAFGLVQVEAMASGCPVINTAIPHSGVPWVSPHEKTGLTVPVDDPKALSAAAQRLLDEPGLRDRFSEAARDRVQAEFDHRVMAKRCVEMYERTLAGSKRV
ncbi:MAG: glycosyltransferase [Planctomycetota bacterium]